MVMPMTRNPSTSSHRALNAAATQRYRDAHQWSASGPTSAGEPSLPPIALASSTLQEIVPVLVAVLDLSNVVRSTFQSQQDRALATSRLLGPTDQAPREENHDPTSWWRRLSVARVKPLLIPWRSDPCPSCGTLLFTTEDLK